MPDAIGLRRAAPQPELVVRNELLEESDIETIGISKSRAKVEESVKAGGNRRPGGREPVVY